MLSSFEYKSFLYRDALLHRYILHTLRAFITRKRFVRCTCEKLSFLSRYTFSAPRCFAHPHYVPKKLSVARHKNRNYFIRDWQTPKITAGKYFFFQQSSTLVSETRNWKERSNTKIRGSYWIKNEKKIFSPFNLAVLW